MIIVFDLDDTLLNKDLKISDYSLSVIKKLKQQGHIVVISTLRSLSRTIDFSQQINADYCGCFLGNLCYKGNKIIRNNPLDIGGREEEIVSDFQSVYSGWIGFETAENSYIGDKETAARYDGVDFIDSAVVLQQIKNNNLYKLSFQCKDDVEIIEKFKSLAAKYGFDYKFSKGFRYCDLVPKNTDKVNFISLLKEKYPEQKIVVCGDDISDLKSMQVADIGVAVANSKKEVLESATYVVESNSDDGVCKFLEQKILTHSSIL